MTSRFFERRSFRNQLKTYLDSVGWTDLTWSESFTDFTLDTIKPPFIGVTIIDFGKEEMEMGADPTINKLYTRRAQVNIYMESEDRTDALCDDISDFMDLEAIIIKDNNNNVLGSMVSDTSSIMSDTLTPNLQQDVTSMEWEGLVSCLYEVHYPNG